MDSDNNNNKNSMRSSKYNKPLLLVPKNLEEVNGRSWSAQSVFYGESTETTSLLLPSYGRRFCGSSEDWLITVNKDYVVTLYKPFGIGNKKKRSESIVHFPPLFPLSDDIDIDIYISKATTFTNQTDLTCVVIFGDLQELAYITKGAADWSLVIGMELTMFDDVVYHNGEFYAITCEGMVVRFNPLESPEMRLVAEAPPYEDYNGVDYCFKRYLVQVSGLGLLQVKRYGWWYFNEASPNRFTTRFQLLKLNGSEWEEVSESLGNVSLFLGNNTSFSVVSSKYAGCRSNSIYFTHEEGGIPMGNCGPSDLGAYNLQLRTFFTNFSLPLSDLRKMQTRVPIWLLPSLS